MTGLFGPLMPNYYNPLFGYSSGHTGLVVVYGYSLNCFDEVDARPFYVELSTDGVQFSDDQQIRKAKKRIDPDPTTGYWEIELKDTASMSSGSSYVFTFCDNGSITTSTKTIPLVSRVCYNDL